MENQKNDPPQDELLTVEEVAEILKVRTELVRRYIREGRLKAIKVGKFWRIYRDELDSFLETEQKDQVPKVPDKLAFEQMMHIKPDFDKMKRYEDFNMASLIEMKLSKTRPIPNKILEVYESLDCIIADFEADTKTHVMISDSPLWEVTINRPQNDRILIRKYIAVPAKTDRVAIVENLVDRGGSVNIEKFDEVTTFKSFLVKILLRERQQF